MRPNNIIEGYNSHCISFTHLTDHSQRSILRVLFSGYRGPSRTWESTRSNSRTLYSGLDCTRPPDHFHTHIFLKIGDWRSFALSSNIVFSFLIITSYLTNLQGGFPKYLKATGNFHTYKKEKKSNQVKQKGIYIHPVRGTLFSCLTEKSPESGADDSSSAPILSSNFTRLRTSLQKHQIRWLSHESVFLLY